MDETDLRFFGGKKSQPKNDMNDDAYGKKGNNWSPSPTEKAKVLSRPTREDTYDTSHPRVGTALIFNHKNIRGQMARLGTERDRDRMRDSLQAYGFDVRVHNDLNYAEIDEELRATAREEHGDSDCFVLVVLSHGTHGQIYAQDTSYPVERLWNPFLGENCKSLINKPKLFFIQACRGENLEKPVVYRSSVSSLARALTLEAEAPEVLTYAIPSSADILVMYSTFENHYSFRNVENGSWFIQSLCTVLDRASESAEARTEGSELLGLLTAVNRKVAYEYQSNAKLAALSDMKEMPNVMSTLTKIFHLKVKRRR